MSAPPSSTPSSSHRLDHLLNVESFSPPEEFVQHAKVTDPAIYDRAAADAPAWWAEQARTRLDWQTPFSQVLDDSNAPFYTWFADGTINASYNCLDRHVNAGHGDRVAFYWHGEEGEERTLTYAGLLADVQRLANALKSRGVRKGDVVGIFLPMIPEVVVAMLACARIGAPHNVVFGGFSPSAVRERMEVSRAKALITADGAPRQAARRPRSSRPSTTPSATWPPWRPRRRPVRGLACSDAARPGRVVRRAAGRAPSPSARRSRWRPSTRCSCCTHPVPRPSRRASCTPPAGT